MLLISRLVLVMLFMIYLLIMSVVRFSLQPRNPKHVACVARNFSRLARLMGIKLIVRKPADLNDGGPYVFVGNHQNNFDLMTMTAAVQPGTVSVGKKSLVWVPIFGFVYWLSGNILIDRNNKSKAVGTISAVADRIRKGHLSIWMFAEGTRSRGRGLLPFKTGAFHTAIQAEVPIVPVCCSNTHNKIKLNRWDNGEVIIEIMAPIPTVGLERSSVRKLSTDVHAIMKKRIDELSVEARDA
ncbi:1-acylglycerol-3-phosphate O-acyltransferase [Moritella viscosa]|uniref:1-acyl-sn-glycerol-3-phosphate acyltransferase n=1 Tax=Moritella viscosa TaxID=80854 RepID=A0A090KDU9_9GAMM|nr:1-acylglycerol-3-phosphate O-acyltransferase [Moritella viscosa]CED62023.1 1-acyl-sn-glycerol-3-phosphate acyltransferase [Moritella viscosa]SGY91918.1 Putative 1-acyl-sn-glycerol-3-phosphateacyltransferase [Moritella viscosa]SGY96275.1 Putative 1-acyl-sn-glycerol-3-phosphateacyltransferase [Moritella viscosa]SGY96677.1 Putative 1-acyl-sn-glycerol-3-phosphateacyltransferase [Moritella viscosa]SGZ01834.1 Putative 1-acyl-sn-glycerol-3-phosphateacyltransferase [Moritella viscosa]